jgi:hypothetical protein
LQILQQPSVDMSLWMSCSVIKSLSHSLAVEEPFRHTSNSSRG